MPMPHRSGRMIFKADTRRHHTGLWSLMAITPVVLWIMGSLGWMPLAPQAPQPASVMLGER